MDVQSICPTEVRDKVLVQPMFPYNICQPWLARRRPEAQLASIVVRGFNLLACCAEGRERNIDVLGRCKRSAKRRYRGTEAAILGIEMGHHFHPALGGRLQMIGEWH